MHRSGDPRAVVLGLFMLFSFTSSAFAFTQRSISIVGTGDLVPMGHEWVTRMAAIELIGYEPGTAPDCKPGTQWCDPKDPRREWSSQGLAKNLDLSSAEARLAIENIKKLPTDESTFASRYKPVLDAILGERWVDITGYNILTSQYCWTAVAQESVDAQYDHFMRKWNEFGGEGGLTAAQQSRARFIKYFVNAAMAPPTTMYAYDGGAQNSTAMVVDRNYFLFGRAVHLLQDSFSSEHTVRSDKDSYTRIHQVLSYMCAKGAEQHTHSNKAVADFSSGDVIWNPGTRFENGWAAYRASNMKSLPLAATEASKDLWAAFIRTMGTPMDRRKAVAQAEAEKLAANWLSFDDADVVKWYDTTSHRGRTFVGDDAQVAACMTTIESGKYSDPAKRAAVLVENRRQCLYNHLPWPGYQDLADPSTDMYYSWQWLNGPGRAMSTPDKGWQPPALAADTGKRVRLKSVLKDHGYAGVRKVEQQASLRAGDVDALDFIQVGPDSGAMFRMTNNPRYFISYRNTLDGAAQLFDFSSGSPAPTTFAIESISDTVKALKETYWKQYLWVGAKYIMYVSSDGKRENDNARWLIEEQQLTH